MADDSSDLPDDSKRGKDLIDEATTLIGTEQLWSGQLLYPSVQLGILNLLDDNPSQRG